MEKTKISITLLPYLVMMTTLIGCGSTARKPDRVEVLHSQPVTEEYTVQAGDTINKIAKMHHMTPEDVVAMNNLIPPYAIYVGQKLKLQSADSDTIVVKQVFYS